ncbi:hypothetical protein [Aeromicrobium sp.]|uniref:hypothetical protein n=1 Tax=Aeromicrobium sp. TaxID=1871063 RepID=UPI003D6AE8CC
MSISLADLLKAAKAGYRAARNSLREAQVDPAPEGESGTCTNYWNMFEANVSDALAADRAGNTGARNEALDNAKQTKDSAADAGCSWAQF